MNNKSGNIEIIAVMFMIVMCIFLTSSLYYLNMQINMQINKVKQDIFYISQNAFFSLDRKELAYENYIVNEYVLKNKIETVLKKMYKNVELKNISYDETNNILNINLTIKIKPIILYKEIGEIKININESVKLKIMEVKYE